MLASAAMSSMTRREWGTTMAGGLLAASAARLSGQTRSIVHGVRLGAQSYSFRDRPLAQVVEAMRTVGLSFCELWQGHVETGDAIGAVTGMPRAERRERLRTWRLGVPLAHFEAIRQQFTAAGVTLTAYNLSFVDDFTDEEIARGFEMARALGVEVITASSTLAVVPRVAAAAAGAKMRVAFHNHSNIRPNEFATPDNFATALAASPLMAVNLDIGHFTAANFDALDYLDRHHARIVSLHLKDRKRDQGPNLPFGEGDTPIAAVLQRLRDRQWDIPAHIEYEYKGGDTVAEVTRCYAFCRRALESK
jgi:sugar phosphate isomerase/epimerase